MNDDPLRDDYSQLITKSITEPGQVNPSDPQTDKQQSPQIKSALYKELEKKYESTYGRADRQIMIFLALIFVLIIAVYLIIVLM